jgi:hypothetical protein
VYQPSETSDELGRFNAPDGVDDVMSVRNRHGYPSHHH